MMSSQTSPLLHENKSGFSTMSSALPDAKNYHQWILDLIYPWLKGTALEVGVGYGQYTREICKRVKRLYALDLSEECIRAVKILSQNICGIVSDLSSPELLKKVEDPIDTIICLNVLEHIESDERALSNFYQLLSPGGKLLLLVPAFRALYGPMDRMAGHYRRYGKDELKDKLIRSGFKTRELNYLNSIGGLGWWVNSKFLKPKSLSDEVVNKQILFFDRFIQPVSKTINPLTKNFFGQSLWTVAEKIGS